MKHLLPFFLLTLTLCAQDTYVNVGGPQYTDAGGHIYIADTGCSSAQTFSRGGSIANTSDPILYQTGRSDLNSIGCTFSVSNFTFQLVTLRFAETNPAVTRAGQRIFNVFVNGALRYPALDIFGIARQANTAVDITIGPVSVTTGSVNIVLGGITGSPVLQALSIVQYNAGGSTGAGGGFYVSGFTGSTTNYTGTTSATLAALGVGQQFIWKPDVSNSTTGPCLNVNTLGCKPVVHKADGLLLAIGELDTTQYCFSLYDGTSMLTESCFTGPGTITMKGNTALATPAAGYGNQGFDTTAKVLKTKASDGLGSSTVIANACATQVVQSISADGVITCGPAGGVTCADSIESELPFGPPATASQNGGQFGLGANQTLVYAFTPKCSFTFSKIVILINTGSGASKGLQTGIYSAAGARLAVSTVITAGGSPNLNTTGAKTLTYATPLALVAGTTYYFAMSTDSTALVLESQSGNSTFVTNFLNANANRSGAAGNVSTGTGGSVALPATLGGVTGLTSAYGVPPIILMEP